MKAATATAFHHLTASSVLDSGRSSRSITRCLLLFSQIPRSISFITRDLVSVLDRFSLPRVPLPFVSDFDWCLPNRESLLSSNARILSLRFGIHCFVKHRNLRESFHLSLEWKWPEHGRTIQRSFEHEYNLPRNCLPFRRNLCLFNGSVVTNFLAVPNIYIYIYGTAKYFSLSVRQRWFPARVGNTRIHDPLAPLVPFAHCLLAFRWFSRYIFVSSLERNSSAARLFEEGQLDCLDLDPLFRNRIED